MKNNLVEKKDRKLWLDALRGIAMLFVVYGHCVSGWTEYFVFTSPIKMPLFFAISGYLFKPRGGNQGEFYRIIFLKLVIPWFVLGMIPYNHPFDRFLDLLSGRKVWFMPCLIISEVLWFYIHKYSRKDSQIIIFGIFASFIGFIMNKFDFLHYAMINTAFIVQIFFVLGYLIRINEDYLSIKWRKLISFSFFVYLALGFAVLFLFPGQALDVHKNSYFNIPICALMISIGCISLFTLFNKVDINPKWLVYIGQNTLIIYLLHALCFSFFTRGCNFFNIDLIIPLPWLGIIKTIFACIMCCFLAWLSNRYLPEIAGKSRRKK